MNLEKLTMVKIEVTERLIKAGTVNDSMDCPFARALRKVVRKNVDVTVEYELIILSSEMPSYSYQEIVTPARVSKFMEKIDARDLCNISVEFDAEGEPLPIKLPPLPKAFAINLKIKNKFLRPSLRK